MPQQPNSGWTPVDSEGWTPVGVSPGDEGYEAASKPYGNPPPDSVVGGALRRGKQELTGLVDTFGPQREGENAITSIPAYRMGKGLVEGEKEAASQTKKQFKEAGEVKGDPVIKAGKYARAGVTGLSMLDPFATGSVTNVNRLQDQGRYKEAIGAGAFDVLTLLAGKLTGGEKTTASKVDKLGFASGGAESAIELSLPEIEKTVKDLGKQPKTIGEFGETVQSTLTRLDQQFNTALSKAKGKFVPRQIS